MKKKHKSRQTPIKMTAPHKSESFRARKVPQLCKENIFCIDSSVLMKDCFIMYNVKGKDVFIPSGSLFNLDRIMHKPIRSEYDRKQFKKARKAINVLLYIARSVPMKDIHKGVPLIKPGERVKRGHKKIGKMYFEKINDSLKDYLNPKIHDHAKILSFINEQKEVRAFAKKIPVLITENKMMLLVSLLAGVKSEEYRNVAIKQEDLRSTGVFRFPSSFLESQNIKPSDPQLGDARGRSYYDMVGSEVEKVIVNEFIVINSDKKPEEQIHVEVVYKTSERSGKARVREVIDFQNEHTLFGFHALSTEQNFLFNALKNPKISCIVVGGKAGTGKTFSALIGMCEMIKDSAILKIISTRDAIDVGEKLGFFPGSPEEKMANWMGGFSDNLNEALALLKKEIGFNQQVSPIKKGKGNARSRRKAKKQASKNMSKGNKSKATSAQQLVSYIEGRGTEVCPLSLIRGRTLKKVGLILEEVQNCTPEQVELAGSRMSEGSIIVYTGNDAQIDTMFSPDDSGLAFAISKVRHSKEAVYIELCKNVRRGASSIFS